jgi:hypothetical protein
VWTFRGAAHLPKGLMETFGVPMEQIKVFELVLKAFVCLRIFQVYEVFYEFFTGCSILIMVKYISI